MSDFKIGDIVYYREDWRIGTGVVAEIKIHTYGTFYWVGGGFRLANNLFKTFDEAKATLIRKIENLTKDRLQKIPHQDIFYDDRSCPLCAEYAYVNTEKGIIYCSECSWGNVLQQTEN